MPALAYCHLTQERTRGPALLSARLWQFLQRKTYLLLGQDFPDVLLCGRPAERSRADLAKSGFHPESSEPPPRASAGKGGDCAHSQASRWALRFLERGHSVTEVRRCLNERSSSEWPLSRSQWVSLCLVVLQLNYLEFLWENIFSVVIKRRGDTCHLLKYIISL